MTFLAALNSAPAFGVKTDGLGNPQRVFSLLIGGKLLIASIVTCLLLSESPGWPTLTFRLVRKGGRLLRFVW